MARKPALPAPEPLSLADVPGAPSVGSFLCRVNDIPDNGARTFVFTHNHLRFEMFIQRKGDDYFAYENSCPHARLPLNMRPNKFLNFDKSHLHCTNHGASFRIEDGYCTVGPCMGKWLQRVATCVADGKIIVA